MQSSGHIFQENTLPTPQTAVDDTTLQAHEVTGIPPKPPPPVTPQNSNSTSSIPVQPLSSGSGRMVTRVSSGAIRHKSVGELLGERDVQLPMTYVSNTASQFTPKHTPTRPVETYRDPLTFDSLAAGFQETPSIQKTPFPPTGRTRGTVFQDSTSTTLPSSRVELDRLQAAAEIFPLDHLVSKAHKSVRTSDWGKALEERQTIAICNRIAELKDQHLWSLRQPAKQKAPSRPNSHWDYLLKEMEWMSTDFYEERKFKISGAFLLARAVQEYHKSSDRKGLLHKVRPCDWDFADTNSGLDDYELL
jgi:chromatin modification-related protein VID21